MTLKAFFIKYPKIAIAFSGGTDSAYLCYMAKKYAKEMTAIYVSTAFQPTFEKEDAIRFCKEYAIPLTILERDVLSQEAVVQNPANRCYYCKKVIFSEKGKTASKITATEPSESKDKRLIQKIQHELNLIGISPKVVGYRYLTDAILATINEPNTHIFKMLGEKYKKTDASIERAMQNAINRAWRTSDIDDLLTYYTARIHSQKGVPTIMEFIFYYANKIQNQL